jgi:hypothetical protein
MSKYTQEEFDALINYLMAFPPSAEGFHQFMVCGEFVDADLVRAALDEKLLKMEVPFA